MRRIVTGYCGGMHPGRRFGTGGAAVLALSALSFAACAADPSSSKLSAEQAARITHACAVTMGFSPGTVQYADCVASLSNSVVSLRPAHGVTETRPECVDRPGNPACPAAAPNPPRP
jgi:hypothetical protein